MKKILVCFSFLVLVISCKTPLENCGCLGIEIHKYNEGLFPYTQLNKEAIDSIEFEHIFVTNTDSVITIIQKLDNLEETPNIPVPSYDYLIRLRCSIGCGGYNYLDYFINPKNVKLNQETYNSSDSLFEYLENSFEQL